MFTTSTTVTHATAPADVFAAAASSGAARRSCRTSPARADRIDRPENGTHVVGILDAIEYDDERGALVGGREIGQRGLARIVDLGDDALVDRAAALAVQDDRIDALHGDPSLRGEVEELPDAVVRARPDAHAPDAARTKSLTDRIDAEDNHFIDSHDKHSVDSDGFTGSGGSGTPHAVRRL